MPRILHSEEGRLGEVEKREDGGGRGSVSVLRCCCVLHNKHFIDNIFTGATTFITLATSAYLHLKISVARKRESGPAILAVTGESDFLPD
ncbi:hypothetical protein NDU88_001633 [Pleurodeles waltl]|uniref:Uncharacterized protein n=1 Tax=Pleurodeles waltl TaxID=8319 RepID=A0AAV7Q4E7_PLEWA|nr:hypothetical protein NDU88_001633 [Pleurodeles waltl]